MACDEKIDDAEKVRRQKIAHGMRAHHEKRRQSERKESHRATGLEQHFDDKAKGK